MKNQKLCEMKVSRDENETAKMIRDHLNNSLRDQIKSNWEGFVQCFKSPFKRCKIDFHDVEFVYALKKLWFFKVFLGVITRQNQDFYIFLTLIYVKWKVASYIIRRRVVMGWITQTYNKIFNQLKNNVGWG